MPVVDTEIPSSASANPATVLLKNAGVPAELNAAPEPAWLTQRRCDAWERCNRDGNISELGLMVDKKDERWRFAAHKGWQLKGAMRPNAYPGSLREELRDKISPGPTAGGLTFLNDIVADQRPLSAELARQGVIFLPLAEAIAQHPDLLREHLFQRDHAIGGDKFLALHQACTHAGTFLYVPDGVEIPETLVAAHWAAMPGAALFPHTLIVAGANSTVNFLDYYGSAEGSGEAWVAGAATLVAGPGARVFRKSIQNFNVEARVYQTDTTHCARDAQVKSIAVHLGGARSRYESYAKLDGPGANLQLYALTIATGQQEFDQRTFQDHAAPRATSNLLYKNALLDESRTIFSGMIRVEPAAEETDAYQQNRNLLLNPAAEADSLPGLEILNQNVRCTHGATTSRLDPEELFYLRARGIPLHVAHQLLVFGFFEEVIQKVESKPLAELLRKLAREKFEK